MMVRVSLLMVMFLLFVPSVFSASVPVEDESWTFEGYAGCVVRSDLGVTTCNTSAQGPKDLHRFPFTVSEGIEAVRVSLVWDSDFAVGPEEVTVRLEHPVPCDFPQCYGAESSWRAVGTVTLSQGETGVFDDASRDTDAWSFAGVTGETALRLTIWMGNGEPGVYLDTEFAGTVVEHYL